MKKIVKIITIIMIIVIVICGIYYALNKNYFKKKKAVEDDEKNYGEEYMEFKSAVYKEKPDRIIIKKQGTTNEDYIYDTDFNRDIFLRFSKGTRLYRLVDYLIEREHKYTINKLREKISKEEFVPANQILSGFKYMNPTSFAD